jgi:hypothetical protein
MKPADGRRFDRSSRRRLNAHTAHLFDGETLFDRVARTVCGAECLPRKELFEAWEVAKRVRRHFRGGMVVEPCAGHGLLAYLLLLLDDTSPAALCVDRRKPPSAERLAAALEAEWPRLAGRVRYQQGEIAALTLERTDTLVASVHACGALTDRVLDLAIEWQARVVVMPCCHTVDRSDTGALTGWLPAPLAIDVMRAERLRAAGYDVRTKTIPDDITPQNRLLMGAPAGWQAL